MVEKMDYYEKLRQNMDKWPTRAPKSAGLMKILRELFTEEEVEIISHIKIPTLDRVTPAELAERCNKSLEKAGAQFEREYIHSTLIRHNWDTSKTATELKIKEDLLQEKIKSLGISFLG